MKLRNKKTGEIGELKPFVIDEKIAVWIENKSYPEYRYNSLAELNEEWEDYEEPKDHWYIDYRGYVYVLDPKSVPNYSREAKQIGNYFETREQAEEAVEKLKAWKRLKDNGFRFTFVDLYEAPEIRFFLNFGPMTCEEEDQARDDLSLLFGGEE